MPRHSLNFGVQHERFDTFLFSCLILSMLHNFAHCLSFLIALRPYHSYTRSRLNGPDSTVSSCPSRVKRVGSALSARRCHKRPGTVCRRKGHRKRRPCGCASSIGERICLLGNCVSRYIRRTNVLMYPPVSYRQIRMK